MIQISTAQARRLALVAQGLHRANPFGAGKQAALNCIEHLGYVQVDSISVIRRDHHHVLWTRVPSYAEAHLEALQKERKVVEYWAHAAAYLPMRDFRYCLPYMHAIAAGQKHWRSPDRPVMAAVFDRIRSEGALKAQDLTAGEQGANGWGWNWKPSKAAL